MHFVNDLVRGIGEVDHSGAIAGGDPGPSSSVGLEMLVLKIIEEGREGTYSAFNENVLGGGTSCSDSIDTCLVKLSDKSVGRLIVELVIAVEDHIVVGGEFGSDVSPEGLEVRCGSEDGAVVSSKVVGIDNSVSASCSNKFNSGLKSGKVSGIEGSSH